jgi:hypothetical protein
MDETVETVALDETELTDRAGECERTEEVSEVGVPDQPAGAIYSSAGNCR